MLAIIHIVLLIVFGVMAVRVAHTVHRESAIFLEFKQSRSIALLVFLFPLGPLILFVGPFRLGWLVAVVLAAACYLPAFVAGRRRIAAFERAGTDRVRRARNTVTQAAGTALAGLLYVAVVLIFYVVAASQQGEFGA